ncbi:MAG: Lipoprotein signal peptidase [Alphaproteobacteria bacterium MarineAlpha11_Bin1]|nr:MAG: Lipoprotein signal peptidase [Alphaproteobacteria bacterium MarineAlpha11_Bin1]|tara:strand:+ start:12345 stop:12821 length:477 start_codon:yes stop_codon:yes gene_type:complete
MRLGFSISALVVLCDQASKYWIVHNVMEPPQRIEVSPFLNIVMVWNKGASFGLFSSQSPWTQVLLGGLALTICIFLVKWLKNAKNLCLATSLGLVIGGAVGNVIDRVIYRAVADFLDFHAGGFHWPAFNIADVAITTGIIILLFDCLIRNRHNNTLLS